MEAGKKIELALAYKGISKAELARMLGMSKQTLHIRLITGKFSFSELDHIASLIGARFEAKFVFKDGTEV